MQRIGPSYSSPWLAPVKMAPGPSPFLATVTGNIIEPQAESLREKLFKVAALIKHSTRRFWLHLASGWPYQDLLRGAIGDVVLLEGPT